jgi:hypothetical protein
MDATCANLRGRSPLMQRVGAGLKPAPTAPTANVPAARGLRTMPVASAFWLRRVAPERYAAREERSLKPAATCRRGMAPSREISPHGACRRSLQAAPHLGRRVSTNGARRGKSPFVPRSPAARRAKPACFAHTNHRLRPHGLGGSPMGVGAGLKPAPTRRSAHVPVPRGHANGTHWGDACRLAPRSGREPRPPWRDGRCAAGVIRMERAGAKHRSCRVARRHAGPSRHASPLRNTGRSQGPRRVADMWERARAYSGSPRRMWQYDS